ncbi:unnamed protein product [Brassica oleracea var. botrytis]|nr:unnamed protein product [Brassica napus]
MAPTTFFTQRIPSVSQIFSMYTSLSAFMILFRTILTEIIPTKVRDFIVSRFRDFFSSYFNPNFTFIIEERCDYVTNQTFRAAETYLPTLLAGISTGSLLVRSSNLKNPLAKPKYFHLTCKKEFRDKIMSEYFTYIAKSSLKILTSRDNLKIHTYDPNDPYLWSSCVEERIIVFTTNHKEKLDPALLRPGRMDVHILMDYCAPNVFKKLAAMYLDYVEEHDLFEPIEKMFREVKATPAEVIEQLMVSKDPDVALKGLMGFLESKKMIRESEESEPKEADEE